MPLSSSLAHRASLSARSAASSRSLPLGLRSYAIPPGATPSPLPSSATIPISTSTQKRVVPTVATPTSQATSSIPVVPVVPPPSNATLITPGGPQKKSGSFKGKVGWTLFTVLNAYIIATYIALHNDDFEEVYTAYVPGGASIYEWADDHDMERVGVQSAVDGYNRIAGTTKSLYRGITGQTFDPPATSTNPNHSSERLAALQKSMTSSATELKNKANATVIEPVTKYASDVKDAAVKAPAKDAATTSAPSKADDARAKAFAAVDDSKLVLEKKAEDAKKKAEAAKAEAEKQVEQAKAKAGEVKKEVVSKVEAAQVAVGEKARELKEAVVDKAHDLKNAVVPTSHTIADLKEEALKGIESLKSAGGAAVDRASELLGDAKVETKEKASSWSDGVEDLVHQAESALGTVKQNVEHKVEEVKETAEDLKNDLAPVKGEKVAWTGGPLPLGFEPPPGYFVAKPAASSAAPNPTTEGGALPLIAPKVQSFSTSEPIISHLASTIDSLASYLSSNSVKQPPSTASYTSAEKAKVLIDNAVGDLEALGGRLAKVQEDAKKELEIGLEKRRVEYENEVKKREGVLEEELEKREEGWKGVVEDERRRLVEVFREKLERELEAQSEIINERLKEEVLAQGIELQRRWIREIKLQVETERGGRLSKLEGLEKGLKDLEKVTLDNSAVLDENVKVHTLWSALRAVEHALENPRQPFTAQLHALSSTLSSSSSSSPISTALSTIPASLASSGVETLPDLTYWFTTRVAPRIRSVALVPESADSGVLSHLASALLSPVLFKKTGNVEGDDVASVLARAEDRLSRKDLDGAAREVNALKGWAGVLAGDWLKEARRRLEVEQALEIVKTEATLQSLLLV